MSPPENRGWGKPWKAGFFCGCWWYHTMGFPMLPGSPALPWTWNSHILRTSFFRGFSVGKHGAIIERGPSRASMRFTAAQQLVLFGLNRSIFLGKVLGWILKSNMADQKISEVNGNIYLCGDFFYVKNIYIQLLGVVHWDVWHLTTRWYLQRLAAKNREYQGKSKNPRFNLSCFFIVGPKKVPSVTLPWPATSDPPCKFQLMYLTNPQPDVLAVLGCLIEVRPHAAGCRVFIPKFGCREHLKPLIIYWEQPLYSENWSLNVTDQY